MAWFEDPSIDYSVLTPERAAALRDQLRTHPAEDPAIRWGEISRHVLRPSDPFSIHRDLFRENYRGWDAGRGPQPAVLPPPAVAAGSNVGRWLAARGFSTYEELHRFSIAEREAFLQDAVERLGIRFRRGFDRLLDLGEGVERPHWFKGAKMNIADTALAGDPARDAVLFRREDEDRIGRWSLGELAALSGRVANGLGAMGLRPGDPVAIDMPMTPESVAIYLGIVRAGMSVVSIADSFSADEIATRLRIAGARAIFTQDAILRGGRKLPLYERVVQAGGLPAIVLPAGDGLDADLRAGDAHFTDFLSDRVDFDNVACDPRAAINILFSSGTTGEPKAIPWDHTTPVRSALDGYVHQGIQPGDVVAWPTNIGWMMGPWLIFAALINRGVIALYSGMPNGRGFCRFVQDARVNVLGVVPSLVRAWRRDGAITGLDWSAIRAFSSTGESSTGEDMLFLMAQAGYKPMIEYCGGTEIGGGYFSSTVIQPNAPSCFAAKAIGTDFTVLDEQGAETAVGELYLIPPSIGLSIDLLNQDHHAVYYEGCPRGKDGEVLRRHGDEVEVLPGGYFRALGRADDTMNLGGIKVSSVELERAMNRAPGVVETAAIAVSPPGGGPSRLVVYAVTEEGAWPDAAPLGAALQERIRADLNPLFRISEVVLTSHLPRTASNKVMRRLLRKAFLER